MKLFLTGKPLDRKTAYVIKIHTKWAPFPKELERRKDELISFILSTCQVEDISMT